MKLVEVVPTFVQVNLHISEQKCLDFFFTNSKTQVLDR